MLLTTVGLTHQITSPVRRRRSVAVITASLAFAKATLGVLYARRNDARCLEAPPETHVGPWAVEAKWPGAEGGDTVLEAAANDVVAHE